ncbi:MAG TPA: hypothetical protein VGF48_12260 [Thermoanaerobaculia bacterium]|jgi:hypothetical protein
MRRRVIAVVWIAGATVPLLLATVFLFGCCVLPFHQVAHKLMPVCHVAADLMRGETAPQEGDAVPPAPGKQEPVKRIISTLTPVQRLAAIAPVPRVAAPSPASAYRSFITHGAVRCDRDVGLHVLVATFRL